jgi:glycosyltransferase involved in cell wall biosynthesis
MPTICSNSFEGRDFICRKFAIPEDRVVVINNGIDLPDPGRTKQYSSKLGIDDSKLIISMLANHTEYKDHTTLIKAFAKLVRSEAGSNCRLLLPGRHSTLTQQLKALCFDLDLSGYVHFPGVANPSSEVWQSTDLAVHSSCTEGCPNAVLEAMAFGLPVCGTRISGMLQALGDESAEYLSPERNADALTECMRKLVMYPEVREKLGRENRLRIQQRFSREQLCWNVLQLIYGTVSSLKQS